MAIFCHSEGRRLDEDTIWFAKIDSPLSVGNQTAINWYPMTGLGVRRDKAALYQWVRDPPG